MPTLRNFTDNAIANPFARGQRILIPAGTPLRSTHPRRDGVYYSKRAQHITVHTSSVGYIDLWNDAKRGRGFVNLPSVTWVGTGSYWIDAKVTPELCKANGVETPALPQFSDYEQRDLDVLPGYGPGYDNRD